MPKPFDYGQLPSDWDIRRLADVTPPDRPIVYGIVQAGPHVEDGVPYLRSTDVGGRIDVRSLPRTSREIAEKYRRANTHPGDLVFSLRGNIGEMSVVPPELKIVNLTQGTARISVNGSITVDYLRHVLSSPVVVSSIASVAKGSTFREISIDQLRKVLVPVPRRVAEQQAISSVLTAWDRGIERVADLIAARVRFKRGMMQQLLTGKRRFENYSRSVQSHHTACGDLPTDWRMVPLSCITRELKRKNDDGVTRVLTASGTRGLVDQREFFNRKVAGESLDKYYLLKRGEFAYNRSLMKGYPYGATKRLDDYDAGVLSTLYLCFQLANDECNSDFMVLLFESGILNSQLRGIARMGARAHGLLNVTADEFFDMVVPLPSAEEQQRIVDVFAAIDHELDILGKELNALKSQKKGLMQKLLTGQLRVKVR